jgi:hypothetical protein
MTHKDDANASTRDARLPRRSWLGEKTLKRLFVISLAATSVGWFLLLVWGAWRLAWGLF